MANINGLTCINNTPPSSILLNNVNHIDRNLISKTLYKERFCSINNYNAYYFLAERTLTITLALESDRELDELILRVHGGEIDGYIDLLEKTGSGHNGEIRVSSAEKEKKTSNEKIIPYSDTVVKKATKEFLDSLTSYKPVEEAKLEIKKLVVRKISKQLANGTVLGNAFRDIDANDSVVKYFMGLD